MQALLWDPGRQGTVSPLHCGLNRDRTNTGCSCLSYDLQVCVSRTNYALMGLNLTSDLILGKMLDRRKEIANKCKQTERWAHIPPASLAQPPRLWPASGFWMPVAVRVSSRWQVTGSLGLGIWQPRPSWLSVPGKHTAARESLLQEAGPRQLASRRQGAAPGPGVQGI